MLQERTFLNSNSISPQCPIERQPRVSDVSHGREQAREPRWLDGERAWLITRYADVSRLLKSEDVSIVEIADNLQKLSDRMNGAFANLVLLLGTSHPLQNSSVHRPIRAGLRELLSEILNRWTPDRIDELAVQLLGSIEERNGGDAVQLLARPMPATIVSDALGLTLQDVYRCGELSRDISSIWHRDVHPLRDLRAAENKAASLVQILSSRCGAERFADFAGLAFLTMAGVDTTCGLLGSALHQLSQSRAVQNQLRQDPATVNGFVNETLRCCPPLKRIVGRKTDQDLTLSGVAIPQGAVLIIDIESAHHDPDAYSDPERFDLTRQGPPTLAFGAGAHACVGVALARLEAKVVIDRLLRDYVVLPAGEVKMRPSRDWFEFESVPIRLERS